MAVSELFVGRDVELSRLGEALAGDVRLVLVVGDSGVGKTRFVWEGLRVAATDGWKSGAGGCLPLADKLPLLAVGDALRELARVDGGRLFEASLEAAPVYVRPEVARLLPQLGKSSAAEEPERAEGWHRERLYAAVAELLGGVARRARVVVFVEDVHWADAATLDCLTYLSRPGHGSGLTVVVTCRSDEAPLAEHVADWLAQVRRGVGVREIRLAPLSREETAAQVAGLTDGPPPASFLEEVFARGEGNPFFTEQLVAAALADSVDGKLGPPARLPAGLAELLLARTRRCGENARAVLAALAVAGRPLSEPALSTITGLDSGVVRGALRELAGARLLDSSPQKTMNRPRHALLAEAVAADLLPGERVSLHVATAQVLEETGEATVAAEIAAHWAAAGRGLEELQATVRAADVAERIFAFAEAAQHWQRAIELCQASPDAVETSGIDLPRLYVRAVDAFEASGDEDGAIALAEQAHRRFASHPDPGAAAVINLRTAHFCAIESPEAAQPFIEEALRLLEHTPPSAEQAAAWFDYYLNYQSEGRSEAALSALRRAEDIAESSGALSILARVLSHQGHSLAHAGDIEAGLSTIHRGWGVAEASGDPFAHLWLAGNESDILLKLGRLNDAADTAIAGLEYVRQRGMGRRFHTGVLTCNAAEALIGLGRTNAAALLIDPDTAAPPVRNRWILHQTRAELDLLRGDITGAGRRLKHIRTLPIGGNTDYERDLGQRIAEVALWAQQPRQALDEVETLLARLTGTEYVMFTGWLLTLGMRACADLAERARARRDEEMLVSAVDAARDLADWVEQTNGVPFAEHPFVATIPADRATWDAERSRVAGASDPMAWTAAAKLWDGLGRPHRAGYAWWRTAEAHLGAGRSPSEVAGVLRAAAAAAEEHAPLLAQIRALAQRARIRLDVPPATTQQTTRQSDDRPPFSLTDRELTVLRLLAKGRTNAEIAAALFISPKTASVHVTNILRKLGANNRVQAATIAERAGLLSQPA